MNSVQVDNKNRHQVIITLMEHRDEVIDWSGFIDNGIKHTESQDYPRLN